jgi:hypothetical protein
VTEDADLYVTKLALVRRQDELFAWVLRSTPSTPRFTDG